MTTTTMTALREARMHAMASRTGFSMEKVRKPGSAGSYRLTDLKRGATVVGGLDSVEAFLMREAESTSERKPLARTGRGGCSNSGRNPAPAIRGAIGLEEMNNDG